MDDTWHLVPGTIREVMCRDLGLEEDVPSGVEVESPTSSVQCFHTSHKRSTGRVLPHPLDPKSGARLRCRCVKGDVGGLDTGGPPRLENPIGTKGVRTFPQSWSGRREDPSQNFSLLYFLLHCPPLSSSQGVRFGEENISPFDSGSLPLTDRGLVCRFEPKT